MITWSTDNAFTNNWPITTEIDGQKLSLTVAPWKREVAFKIDDRLVKLTVARRKRFQLSEGDDVLATVEKAGQSFHLDCGARTFELVRDRGSVHRYLLSENLQALGVVESSRSDVAGSRVSSTVTGVDPEVQGLVVALLMIDADQKKLGRILAVYVVLLVLPAILLLLLGFPPG